AVDCVVSHAGSKRIVAGVPLEVVVRIVADDGVVAAAADGGLDGRAKGDRDIGGEPASGRKRAWIEVDSRWRCIAGQLGDGGVSGRSVNCSGPRGGRRNYFTKLFKLTMESGMLRGAGFSLAGPQSCSKLNAR